MTALDMIAATLAAGAIGLYAARINGMTWRTHRPLCIAAQLAGAAAAAGGMYAAGDGLTVLAWAAITAAWAHLAASSARWAGGRPPPETESRPMPLDGATQ